MFRTHDNWERLVAAVIRKDQLWQLCHQHSRTPSLMSSISNASFDFEAFQFQNLSGINIDLSQTRKLESGLVFFKDSPVKFGLQELMMATSCVLGEEIKVDTNFIRTYLVSLETDQNINVVVKVFKVGNIAPVKLEKWIFMNIFGQNENVAEMWGYYFFEGELLCFYEYFPQGSLHAMLHVKPLEDRVVLDWGTRFKIAIGAAKGLVHMHEKYDGTFVHGNIKASNIFLNSQKYGCSLGNPTPLTLKMSKYHPPEVSTAKMLSQKSDVYSFGVLLIELVSGRSPTHSTGRFKTYVDWARFNYREEWTYLVYDTDILDEFGENMIGKKQMFDMLQIAMSCVRDKPTTRPNMNIVVEMLYRSKAEPPLNFFKRYAKWIG